MLLILPSVKMYKMFYDMTKIADAPLLFCMATSGFHVFAYIDKTVTITILKPDFIANISRNVSVLEVNNIGS